MTVTELDTETLTRLLRDQQAAYETLKARGLKLDLTRGKPSAEQLDLSNALLTLPGEYRDAAGTDCRNYGGIEGLVELRTIFAELLGVEVEALVAGDNASLAIMHDVIVFALLLGVPGGAVPWGREPIKFICPVPGYDRHFSICEQYGIEMVNVDLGPTGPDLDQVRALAADPAVRGLWAVPAYANPSGSIYTEEITRALVSMPTAAPDFRIFWDNAYALHHLSDAEAPVLDVLGLAADAGNPDRVLIFASTSKITFAGAGVSFFAASKANRDWYLGSLGKRTIGPNKLNQLAHARYLGDAAGVRALMAKHRAIIAPKFDRAEQLLNERLGEHRLGGQPVATWTEPDGGYFISLDVAEHTASRVVALAKEAGIALTGAGSAFPYRRDPADRNIRIAPTFATLEEVEQAIDGVATCVLLAAAERQLAG